MLYVVWIISLAVSAVGSYIYGYRVGTARNRKADDSDAGVDNTVAELTESGNRAVAEGTAAHEKIQSVIDDIRRRGSSADNSGGN